MNHLQKILYTSILLASSLLATPSSDEKSLNAEAKEVNDSDSNTRPLLNSYRGATDSAQSPANNPKVNEAETVKNWSQVVKKSKNAVVVIQTNRGLGSGFIIRENGLLITNQHVIKGATQISVSFASGEKYRHSVRQYCCRFWFCFSTDKHNLYTSADPPNWLILGTWICNTV